MSVDQQLLPGKILINRYRIVKLIGHGGFGAVYRAWDMNLQKPCALKQNYETSEEATRQFNREATILANLRHRNLPDVTDNFNIPSQGQYLVMDFIEGHDIQQIIDQGGGSLPESRILPWISQVCDALTYLHSQNPPVIHRDIKPANIKITPQGTVVLVDFGIAKIYEPGLKTTIGARAVTPGYSPPEQYGSGRTDARSDIYALGATLYTSLTGQIPVDSLSRQTGTPLPSPSSINPAITQNTESVILQAMQLAPDLRYQNGSEFKAALLSSTAIHQTATQITPLQQPHIPAQTPTYKVDDVTPQVIPYPTKKRPGWLIPLIAILGVLCLFSIAIGFWLFSSLPTSDQATKTQAAKNRLTTQTAIAMLPSEQTITFTPSPTWTLTPTSTPTSRPSPSDTFTVTETDTPDYTLTWTPTPSPSLTPNPHPTWYPCAGLYPSRLHVGDRAFVSYDPPLSNNVRKNPSTNATRLGKIEPGEEMEILEGPICNENMIWWRIDAISKNLTGWTSEGNGEDYWLVPSLTP